MGMSLRKTYQNIMLGLTDSNIPFNGLCGLLKRLGFKERIKGSHHIFFRNDIDEILNLQPIGSKAKAYQVKQVRKVLIKYQLGVDDDDQI